MLQAIRDRAMGVLGWIVIGLIIITFALFGLGSYLQDRAKVYAAKVNDVEITPQQLQNEYQNQRARMEQMLGDAFDPALIDNDRLKKNALEALVQRELLLQAATDNAMAVSDQLLAAQIQAVPAFQADGRFDESRYQQLLMRQGHTPASFEYETRRMLTAEQFIKGLSDTAFVTAPEISRAYSLQEQKRSFETLSVSASELAKTLEPDEAQVEQYYADHTDQYVTPERVRLNYVRLDGQTLAEGIDVAEDDVTALYEQKKTALKTQEQRRASHILFQLAGDADEQAVNAAKAEAESLVKQIRDGADFAELAKAHSDDPGSAAKGGDLGFFASGVMVPEFDKAVFAMSAGEISDPVRSQFGFHIIKLVEVKSGELPTLDAVRDDLVNELKQREIANIYYDQLERLANVSYEHPDSLQAAADELRLEVQTSDWVTATGGDGIAQYPLVRNAAFSEDVLEGGNNSEPLEVGPADAIVLRVVEREPAHPTALAEVREQVLAALKQEKAAQAAADRAQALLKEVEGGASMETLAEDDSVAYGKQDAVGRNAPGVLPELMREVFKLPRPGHKPALTRFLTLANGDAVVVRLSAVADADPDTMSDAQRTQLQRGFENLRRNQTLSVLVENLRERATIEIPDDSEQ